jgi:hypothetical protein
VRRGKNGKHATYLAEPGTETRIVFRGTAHRTDLLAHQRRQVPDRSLSCLAVSRLGEAVNSVLGGDFGK